MALTDQERQTLLDAKAAGKTKEQAMAELFQSRNTSPQRPQGRFSDVGEDLATGASELAGDFSQRGQSIIEGVKAGADGRQTPLESGFQTAGNVAGAVGDIIGRGVQTVGRLFLRQDEEEAVGDAVTGAVEATGIGDVVSGLSERSQRNVEALFGVAEFAGIKGVSSAATKSLAQSDDILAKARASRPQGVGVSVPGLSEIVRDVRFNLSDIDPQVETALKRSSPDDVNRYFQQAQQAVGDTRAATPLELAGQQAEDAYDLIDEARKKAIEGKNRIIDEVGDSPMNPDIISGVKSRSMQSIAQRFGVDIDENGLIRQAEGRASTLDAADSKLISEYMSRLNSLGDAPTLKQVDDFVDWAQSQLYKQSKTLSKLDAADRAVIGQLKQTTGDLNAQLKDQVSNGYGDVNARVSKLIDLQDELSSALGADARKGGGLMKRVFSPTGGNTRRIFEEIRKETGIDLDKEANLAKFAMESAGDTRQKSLLQQLDVAVETADEIDITRPMSLVRFVRERADMDAQELANEIIRRTNADQPNTLPNQ